ncbi:hypothetical protein [Caulobacter mirabilis]|uniref:hypothetical protein n=1 Tax=Caulobacter mirabilis TaxID=69666 RepID=UPI0012375B79|nr:hypothetical protein [Caulobacter mirabilis]
MTGWKAIGLGVFTLLLCAATPGARAAEHSELFEMFEAVCLRHVGDAAGARAQAAKLGFAPLPSLSDDSFQRKSSGGTYLLGFQGPALMFGSGGPPATHEGCSITIAGPDAAAPSALRAWLAMAPTEETGSLVSYSFRENNGVRTRLSAAQTRGPTIDLLQGGPVRLVSALQLKVGAETTTILSASFFVLKGAAGAPASGP